MGRVIPWEKIQQELAPFRAEKKIVFTNGCFDLLHVGHIRYLNQAKALGNFLVVGINSDNSVRKLKGPKRPVQNEQDRAEILSNLQSVDRVVIFEEDTPAKLIEVVRPDFLVKGGDWPPDKIVGYETVTAYGGKVLSLQFVDGKSTTNLISKSHS